MQDRQRVSHRTPNAAQGGILATCPARNYRPGELHTLMGSPFRRADRACLTRRSRPSAAFRYTADSMTGVRRASMGKMQGELEPRSRPNRR